jgi:hypothetical protein
LFSIIAWEKSQWSQLAWTQMKREPREKARQQAERDGLEELLSQGPEKKTLTPALSRPTGGGEEESQPASFEYSGRVSLQTRSKASGRVPKAILSSIGW